MSGHWINDDRPYPAKPNLSPSEELAVLRSGPLFEWFASFAVLGEVRTHRPNSMPYGVAHWYFDAEGNQKADVRTCHSQEDARWAMEILFRRHQESCRCVAIWYWTPAMVNYGSEFSA